MSLQKARQLREERGALHAKATEILKKDKLTPEDRTQLDKLEAEMVELKGDIDRNERAAANEAEISKALGERRENPIDDPNEDETKEKRAVAVAKKTEAEYRSVFFKWARSGNDDLNAEDRALLQKRRAEARDMGIGTGAGGGFFVPQGFVYEVESAQKYFGDMLNICSFLDTSTGNQLPYPTDNDTTNTGELVGEAVQVTTQDVAIGHINFNAYKFSTKMIKVSIELMQDSAFDFPAYLAGKMGERLGRILNTKFTTGNGTSEPGGILTEATASGVTAAGSAANTGGAETGGTTIGSQDLVNLELAVDRAYRNPQECKYVLHDKTYGYLKGLIDKYGRPLWTPGMANNAPDMLNGYPYSINNDMPIMAVNAKPVVFGNTKKFYVRRVRQLAVMRLTERFADQGQIAFLGFARYDSHIVDAGTHPLVYIVNAAS